MAESKIHMDYVKRIVQYITEHFSLSNDDYIGIDLPESPLKPIQIIGDVRPDVYYKNKSIIIIGEAKTENDINNRHTEKQINLYFDELSLAKGERNLIFCTSFYSYSSLKNMILRLKRRRCIDHIKVHIMDENFKSITI